MSDLKKSDPKKSDPESLNGEEETVLLERLTPLLGQWNVSPRSIELASLSENTVFKITAIDQKRYALRIHRPGYHTLEELESEHLWAQALIDAGIKIPQAYETREGDFYEQFQWNGSSSYVGLVDWVNAESLQAIITTGTNTAFLNKIIAELGKICAQLHNQASGWQPPAGFTRHHLNIDGLLGEAPFWGRFWDAPLLTPEERILLLTARERLREILMSYGQKDATYSMIHADLHAGNILVVDDDLLVIDFDDAGYGWHLYDIAVALGPYRNRKKFDEITQSFISAYREIREFHDSDLSLLPYFFLIRSLASIGWSTARPELENDEKIRWLIDNACIEIQALDLH